MATTYLCAYHTNALMPCVIFRYAPIAIFAIAIIAIAIIAIAIAIAIAITAIAIYFIAGWCCYNNWKNKDFAHCPLFLGICARKCFTR